MKNVLAWVKGHLVVVISVVIALVALPALLFVSTGMNASLRESVQEDVGTQSRNLQQISVQYSAEPLNPSNPAESFSATPNEATTEAMRRVIETRDAAARRVLELAAAHNQTNKTPMLEGLFPAPLPAETTPKRQESAAAWLRGHQRVLDEVGAQGPVRAETLAVQLEARRTQEREKRLNTQGVATLSAEEEAEVQRILVDFRLRRLRERADDASFYASMDTFENVAAPGTAGLPSLEEIWDWQHRLWIHEDILRAASAANRDAGSGLVLPPATRPVKRLVSVSTEPWFAGADPSGASDAPSDRGRTGRSERNAPPPRAAASAGTLTSEIRPDFEASITGRAGWPYKPNALYDARYARVVAILDGSGVERFLDAIRGQNFMTVVDLDLSVVSPLDGLVEGYAYGGGSLLRAEMVIETLWLREWIGELAPDGVRQVMGLPPRPEPGAESEGRRDAEEEFQ